MMKIVGLTVSLSLASLLLFGAAAAQDKKPLLLQVPINVAPDARAQFTLERSALSNSYNVLITDAKNLSAKCNSVAPGTQADTECNAEDAAFEARKAAYISRAAAYNNQVRAALQAKVTALTASIGRDQQAIRNLGVGNTAAQYEDWVELSSEAERERDEQCMEALRQAGEEVLEAASFDAIEHGLDKIGSLNPPKANRLITELRSAGITDPYVEDLLRKIAYTADKPEKIRDAKDLIHHLEQTKSIWNLKDFAATDDSGKWKAGADVLSMFVEDKRLQLIGDLTLDEVRASFYSVNNNLARRLAISEIDALTQLSETQLHDLRALSEKLVGDVKVLQQTKGELAKD